MLGNIFGEKLLREFPLYDELVIHVFKKGTGLPQTILVGMYVLYLLSLQ